MKDNFLNITTVWIFSILITIICLRYSSYLNYKKGICDGAFAVIRVSSVDTTGDKRSIEFERIVDSLINKNKPW